MRRSQESGGDIEIRLGSGKALHVVGGLTPYGLWFTSSSFDGFSASIAAAKHEETTLSPKHIQGCGKEARGLGPSGGFFVETGSLLK